MRYDKVLMWWRMKDGGIVVRRMCYLNYEGGCEFWKKKYKLFVFNIRGDLDMMFVFLNNVEIILW